VLRSIYVFGPRQTEVRGQRKCNEKGLYLHPTQFLWYTFLESFLVNDISIRVRKTAHEICNWSGRSKEGIKVEWTLKERMIIALLSGSVVGE